MALSIVLVLIGAACATADQSDPGDAAGDHRCWFGIDAMEPCSIDADKFQVVVEVESIPVAPDEVRLTELLVHGTPSEQRLPISADTTLLEGDRGFVSFDDINFDSIPDLAITTSFGVANLYLDYWVYNPDTNQYRYLGNLPMLQVDDESQVLRATVKVSAAEYEKKEWQWQGSELHPVD